MIPKLIRLGVQTILKIICENIIIKNIQIINKDDKFNGTIDEIYIRAEKIIFNKINISKINFRIRNVDLKSALNSKKFSIDNCNAVMHIKLTKDNINKTLFNKKWKRLKTSIESFVSMNFQSIEINNQSICFISSDTLTNKNIDYNLQYNQNSISLVNTINKEKLSILNDKNIIVNKLLFCENHIELELSSEIMFN